ncbi:MAG: hypothetical protein JO219_03120 [Candidatus Eremiobacteraeota bacterium]|nr:hypothetical protein [Candidatus Eremiobacteraeota bacterium]
MLARQGRRLLQLGVVLLLFTSFWGFAIPRMGSYQLGVSAHSLAGLLAILLLAMGLLWPKLRLNANAAAFAFWFLIYSGLAIELAFVLGAIWSAGNSTMPHAAGAAHGSALQELVIKIIAYSSGPTGIIAFALILWGLRGEPVKS